MKVKLNYLSYFLILSSFLSVVISAESDQASPRQKIPLNKNWKFSYQDQNHIETIDIPHDYSINKDFTTECEPESGFLPGGTGYYTKTFTLSRESPSTSVLFFYGVYKDAYVTVNSHKVGENHYGYNSFAFDVSKYLVLDGKTENKIEVKVENQLFNSRWYAGSGIEREVFLMVTDLVHIGLDGIKVTTPKIDGEKGTMNIETRVVNGLQDMSVKLSYTIKDQQGQTVKNVVKDKIGIKKGDNTLKEEIVVEKINLWSDRSPNLYILQIEIISSEDDKKVYDSYSTKFGFRTFYFDKQKGFVINGIPEKLNGVCLHHDYGALGCIDNYDAAYRRLSKLKEMGVNAIRTTHNPAYRTWIEICDEIGLFVLEEFFDTWTHTKHSNSHDFAESFNKMISNDNEILGKKSGMTWSEYVVKSTIVRDRNSPSIVLWSIGNEIGVGSGDENIAKNLIMYGKEVDDTRPFSRGDNGYKKDDATQKIINQEIAKQGGVVGYNYPQVAHLNDAHSAYGVIVISESASSLNSRGVYSFMENSSKSQKNDGKLHLTSYDVSYASSPGYYCLRLTLSTDYAAGQFYWTGYDYIGEPTPWNGYSPGSVSGKGAYPNSAYFGMIDTAGFEKDTYYLYRAHLDRERIVVHLVTAWDKNNICFVNNSKRSPVHIYSNAAKVELFRDDKNSPVCTSVRVDVKTSAGYEYFTYKVQSNDNNICEAVQPSSDSLKLGTDLFSRYNVEFVEGTKLYTKAYDKSGNLIDSKTIVGRHFIKAPNLQKLKLEVNIDKKNIKADSNSLVFIEVSIVDDEGTLNTKGENLITFSLEGPGKIVGVDNGDQATIEKFQQKKVLDGPDYGTIRAYAGKALAIVSGTEKEGTIKITVSAPDLKYEEEISIVSAA